MSTFIPAYKDTFYEYSGDSLSFYILMEGAMIYQGKAYKSPLEASIKINVNKIAKDYLEQHITDFRDSDKVIHRHPQAFHFFDLYRADGTLLETYGVLFDWEGTFDGSTKVLSDPIKRSISKEMKPLFSVFSLYGDTFYIDFGPAIRNTYFTLLTTNLSINNAGGNYTIQWDTDYYPFSDFIITAENGSVLGYGNRGPSGATVTFAEAPTPAPRTFNVNIYFKNTSTLLGTVQVLQSSVDFNLITKTLNVPPNGGVYTIRWITEVDPAYITAEVVSWPGTTVSGINNRGCTINVPRSLFPNNYPFKVNFYYEWEGERYLLDTTDVNLRGNSDMSTGSTIDSSVTRDILITEEGLFAGFNTGGVILWERAKLDPDGYYPRYNTGMQYAFRIFDGNGGSNNIPLCEKTLKCEAEGTYPIYEQGITLSGSTEWLNEYLETAKNAECTTTDNYGFYSGSTPRSGIVYMLSGSTVLDACVIVQRPNDPYTPYAPIDSGSSTYTFYDLKFKSSGFTESEVKALLSKRIPAHSDPYIWDGVKVVFDSGTNWSNWGPGRVYSSDAITLHTDSEGWTTVGTPLPVTEITSLSGLPATEIWISRNVKILRVNSNTITGITYEGTKQDFRNVKVSTRGTATKYVQCSDGLSYGINSDIVAKSDPLVLQGNEIRPAMCNEYFYATDDPEPSNVVTIVYTGDTVPMNTLTEQPSDARRFFGIDGEQLTADNYETGMTGEYATVTLFLSGDVYILREIPFYWRSIDSSVRYIYLQSIQSTGPSLIEPIEKARILGDYTYSGNTNLPRTVTLKNLRGIVGKQNFASTPVTRLEAFNLITLGESALTGSIIEELYLPSIQRLASYSIPEYCTSLTVGKNLNNVSNLAFTASTYLTSIIFEGTVEEFKKMSWTEPGEESPITTGLVDAYTKIKNNSNVSVISCTDGDIVIDRT